MSKNTQETEPESNLVAHARHELKVIGEDPDYSEKLIEMVKIFSSMGHSGGSAAIAIVQLNELLQYNNLSPLTDDESEWQYHGPEMSGIDNGFWQNRRNSEAFSLDGGKTYYLLSEGGRADNPEPIHHSRLHKPCPQCGTRSFHQHRPTCKTD